MDDVFDYIKENKEMEFPQDEEEVYEIFSAKGISEILDELDVDDEDNGDS